MNVTKFTDDNGNTKYQINYLSEDMLEEIIYAIQDRQEKSFSHDVHWMQEKMEAAIKYDFVYAKPKTGEQ